MIKNYMKIFESFGNNLLMDEKGNSLFYCLDCKKWRAVRAETKDGEFEGFVCSHCGEYLNTDREQTKLLVGGSNLFV